MAEPRAWNPEPKAGAALLVLLAPKVDDPKAGAGDDDDEALPKMLVDELEAPNEPKPAGLPDWAVEAAKPPKAPPPAVEAPPEKPPKAPDEDAAAGAGDDFVVPKADGEPNPLWPKVD